MAPALRTLALCTVAALASAARPERVHSKAKLAAEGGHAVQNETDGLLAKLGFAEADAEVIKSPNMRFFFLSAVGVLTAAMLNSCVKGIFVGLGTNLRQEVVDSSKRILLVAAVIVHVMICYVGTYKSHFHEDIGGVNPHLTPFTEFCTLVHGSWTTVIFIGAVAWVAGTFLQEAYAGSRAPVQDQEIFTASDIYSNASESMFAVTVRFMFQTCLLLVLVFVAESGWRNAPQDVPLWRRVWNVVLSIALLLYMVGQSKRRDAWQEMRRLRTVRCLQIVSEEGKDAPESCNFTMGDYYVRLSMSLVANGLFHKFVLLSYPIFIFGYIGNADMLGIVKDILALLFVMEIDNLSSPVRLRATSVVS